MGTKNELLALLESRRGGILSGEEVAAQLGISRAAIWKAVQALRGQGYMVESIPGSGYRLPLSSDVLSAEAVQVCLASKETPVRMFPTTESTNLEAKRWAIDGAPSGALVLAERQTAGRGRLGRSFESPRGGLYLSVVLRPQGDMPSAGLITSAAAVAVCRAVQQLCGLDLRIKWVNDLYYEDKKCCGILTEAVTGMETGSIENIVVGIGLNYTTRPESFTGAGARVAGSLYPNGRPAVPRVRLAAAIHTQLMQLFNALPDKGFIAEYRNRNMVLGRPVTVLADPPFDATVMAIDDEARLVVDRSFGDRVTLSHGEISVRL